MDFLYRIYTLHMLRNANQLQQFLLQNNVFKIILYLNQSQAIYQICLQNHRNEFLFYWLLSTNYFKKL